VRVVVAPDGFGGTLTAVEAAAALAAGWRSAAPRDRSWPFPRVLSWLMPRGARRLSAQPRRRWAPRSRTSSIFRILKTRRATYSFYLDDCVRVLPALGEGVADAIVTSPPYNLGVSYGSYDDQLPREEYLQWTNRWAAAAAGALGPDGSLFLNVGHKPTDPWVAMDVAQAVWDKDHKR